MRSKITTLLAAGFALTLAGAAYAATCPGPDAFGHECTNEAAGCGSIAGIACAGFLFSASFCHPRMFECVVLSLFCRRRGRLEVQRIDEGGHRTVVFFRNGPLQV